MSTGQLAELIAAGFFAIGVGVASYVLLRLARLITSATEAVAEYRARADSVLAGAQAAVDRASEQLARSDAITASMDDVASNMAELSGHVSALAGLARGIAGGLSGPLLRVAAVTYGVRRATGRRLTRRARALAGGAARACPGRCPRSLPLDGGRPGDPPSVLAARRGAAGGDRLPPGHPAGPLAAAGHRSPARGPRRGRRARARPGPGPGRRRAVPGRRAGRHG